MIKTSMSSKWKALISLLLVLAMSVSYFAYIADNSKTSAKTVAQLEQEASKLEQQIKDINNKINNATSQIKDEREKQALITSQVTAVEKQIDIYEQKIAVVSKNIKDKEAEISKMEADIDSNEEYFAQRVRAMYISNTSTSVLSTLLSAQSFSQFINNTEILKRISQSDQDLITELSEQKKTLEKDRAELKESKADLDKTNSELSAKKKTLKNLYAQSQSTEAALQKTAKQYMADKQKYSKEIAAIEKSIKDILNSSGNSGEAPSQFKWPVPTRSYISSPFGWRTIFGQREFHYGIDIPGPKGTNIVAAAAGEVIMVKKTNYGYGWYVLINHGGGYATLYAHCSRIDVSVGQKVTKGQTIAGIGTTGNSTGYHVHFEVRVNGVQNNPLNYVKQP